MRWPPAVSAANFLAYAAMRTALLPNLHAQDAMSTNSKVYPADGGSGSPAAARTPPHPKDNAKTS